jgi:diacylglycerol kinase family enzyme
VAGEKVEAAQVRQRLTTVRVLPGALKVLQLQSPHGVLQGTLEPHLSQISLVDGEKVEAARVRPRLITIRILPGALKVLLM